MSITAILGLGVGVFVSGTVASFLRPLNNYMTQKTFDMFPNELLPPVNLINLRWRNLMSDSQYTDEMRKQGIDNERATLLYKGSEILLNGYEIVRLYRRGIIDESKRKSMLGELGFTADRAEQLLRVTEEVPSARDIISFAVREVYSPEIAQAFGQFEGVDDVMSKAADDLKATGMTEDAFKKFWAAHWQLPSMFQGYEMLHRRVIDEDALEKLMVALDIMPWWRDKLKAISYSPFTRVDVRRMHKLGTLTEAEVTEAYQDLGFDADKAEKMTRFTVAYNQEPQEAEKTETDKQKTTSKEATKSNIMEAFADRLITEQDARSYLDQIGYSPEAIDLFIASEAYDAESKALAEMVDMIHDGFVRRVYDGPTTVAKLGELDLPAAYTESLLDKWTLEREGKTNRPSKAELFKLFKEKIITEVELRQELAGHGYPMRYIDWYMRLEGVKAGG